MVSIKKTGEGYYLASLETQTEELGRNSCYLIKKELSSIVRPHRDITIDVKGVKSINSGGYKLLQELMDMSKTKRCKIKFINVESGISNQISRLMGKFAEKEVEFE